MWGVNTCKVFVTWMSTYTCSIMLTVVIIIRIYHWMRLCWPESWIIVYCPTSSLELLHIHSWQSPHQSMHCILVQRLFSTSNLETSHSIGVHLYWLFSPTNSSLVMSWKLQSVLRSGGEVSAIGDLRKTFDYFKNQK